MNDGLKKVIDQTTSGRWILTVICGFTFAYAVWKRVLPDAATAAILTSVFTSYFGKADSGQSNNVDKITRIS